MSHVRIIGVASWHCHFSVCSEQAPLTRIRNELLCTYEYVVSLQGHRREDWPLKKLTELVHSWMKLVMIRFEQYEILFTSLYIRG